MNDDLTLGISTISDLLINNKITRDENNKTLDIELTVLDYQRPYKCTAKNVIH